MKIIEMPLKYFSLIATIILFVWISFFPVPIQEKYHLATNVFLIFTFVVLLIEKRISIFKLSDWPLWIFIAAISINVFFAQNKDVALRTYLDLAIPILCIYYLLLEVLSFKSGLVILAKAISIVGMLVALGGILELLFKINPIYEYWISNPYYDRWISSIAFPMSTQYHPSPLGTYLLGCLPFNWLLIKDKNTFLKRLGAISVILNITVIILTCSKGIFLALISLSFFYLFIQRRYRFMAIFFIVLIIFILMCSYMPHPFGQYGVNRLIRANWGIFSPYRINRIIMTQRIISDHPFVGIGFQHFRIDFGRYYPGSDEIPPFEFRIADNMYLTMLAETGIIGFSGFLILILSFLKKGLNRIKKLEFNSTERQWLAIFLSGYFSLLVNLAGYELFYWPNQYVMFCFVLVILGVLVNRQECKL